MWTGEVQRTDFKLRRKAFLKGLKNGVAFFPAAPAIIRNKDVHHPYRQESNFYYLTGFEEPDSYCLFAPNSKKPFQIFVRPKDPKKELWDGKILGPEAAKSQLGADEARPSEPVSEVEEAFIQALIEADSLYYQLGNNPQMDQRIFEWMYKASRRLGRTGRPLWPIFDPDDILGELRVIKSPAEIDRLQRAANISSDAHANAMRIAKPGMYEYEIEAALYHAFRVGGAARMGYGAIVASGANACVLHYVNNDRKMAPNELLLIDAGGEFDYYTADITRVFPVSGTFSPEQRDIYGAVLAAQKSCIKMARPGKTQRDIHNHAVEVLVEELKKLKILKGSSKTLIDKKAYFSYYPHNTGHWLGMDVHDVGKYYRGHYDSFRKLEPGMVFTIEPGLYFGASVPAPARYKGIGVRIEDDILITSSGCKVLTSGVPKEIDEVESLTSAA